MRINENGVVPVSYSEAQNIFREANKEMCEVEGIVSLRWFKNYFIFKRSSDSIRNIMSILQ